MDKSYFLHRLKGLATFRCAGEAVYRACTELVQILRGVESCGFCTIAPVDMHGLVHTLFAKKGARLVTDCPGKQEKPCPDPADCRQTCVMPDLTPGANSSGGLRKKIFASTQPSLFRFTN